jgi:hypothetical protein
MTEEGDKQQIREVMKHFNAWIEPVDGDERRSLELFCKLVEDLERDALFVDLLRHSEVRWKYKVTDEEVVSAEIEKLDEADLRAFVALARLFTQKKERASIRNIAKIFAKRVGEHHPIWWTFNGHRMGLNNFLDTTGPDLLETFRELFDVFVYGHYTHRDDAKEANFEAWKKDLRGFTARKVGFLLAVSTIFWNAQKMRDAAKHLLEVKVEDLGWQPPRTLPIRRFHDGVSNPMFAHEVVSLEASLVERVSKGDRVSLSESVILHIRNFLDAELGDHITAASIGEIDVHEYGSKIGDRWLQRHWGASLAIPVAWESVENMHPRGKMINHHIGKPSLFVTEAFFAQLKPVEGANYKWELKHCFE